jgi:endogenous inhibitor of DNA gyrase (YacG/DUF329 family)
MKDIGAYYTGELARLARDHGTCINCGQLYETNNETDHRYPFRSYLCRCTLCRGCINACGALITDGKEFTFDCPLCLKKMAWNVGRLLPDLQFVNLLHAVSHIVPFIPVIEGIQGGMIDRDDGHEDDHSNGGDVDDGCCKRKWRDE